MTTEGLGPKKQAMEIFESWLTMPSGNHWVSFQCNENNILPQIQFFLKSLAVRFEQIASVHYQAIAHTDN